MENPIKLSIFDIQDAPATSGLRWFVRQGDQVQLDKGFVSKKQADEWVKGFGHRLGWRVGFLFRLRGDTVDTQIVDRDGERASP